MGKRPVLVVLYDISRNENAQIKSFFNTTKQCPPSNITWMTVRDVSEETVFRLVRKIKKKCFSEVRILYRNHQDYLRNSQPLKDIFFEKIARVSLYTLDNTGNGWDMIESSYLPPI
ncbi:MAG: hypothetical protein HGA67_00780 [Candidatus Yonathbacteria bacterium]|nr:hypothetical protein [Candidatus Yonathbacteria bacterium]